MNLSAVSPDEAMSKLDRLSEAWLLLELRTPKRGDPAAPFASRSEPELISAETLFSRRANVTFFSSFGGKSADPPIRTNRRGSTI